MFGRLLAAYFALLVVALGVFGVASARATRARVLEEISGRVESDARQLAVLVRTGAPLGEALGDLAKAGGARLTVIGPDGNVLADSHADPATMDNHNACPEVFQARASKSGRDLRHSRTLGTETMYRALALERPAGTVVRAGLPVDRVRQELGRLYLGLGAVFLAVAAAGTLAAYVLARRLTRPLRELRFVADWITAGDFARKAPRGDTGEMESVARAINRMSEELTLRLRKLEEESSKLQAVVSGMQEGVVAVDTAGRILHWNGAARSLLALPADPRGAVVWEILRDGALEEQVRTVLGRGEAARVSIDVGPRSLSVSAAPTRATGGAVLVARDVTEDRRYETLRKEFVANASHELRTPISVIQAAVETLKDGAWRDEARAPEFLAAVERNVLRLGAIVQDLLELARLEAPGQTVQARRLEAAAVLGRLADSFLPLAEKKRQTLRLESAGLSTFEADPELLDRALGNLVDNAIKYTPEGGRVTVRAAAEGEEAVFSVEDTGIGIAEEHLPRVFERFYRVDKSRSRELGGTGLGLSIVKHVAQLHGGKVEARSRPGQGSTFTLRLPRRAAAPGF